MPSAVRSEDSVPKRLLRCLQTMKDELENDDADLLKKLLKSQIFKSVLKVGSSLKTASHQGFKPRSLHTCDINEEVVRSIRVQSIQDQTVNELLAILLDPFIQNLLLCHDIIASEEFLPKRKLPKNDSRDFKRITIHKKTHEHLGVTIKKHTYTSAIVISRILHGGPAHKEGSLSVGDELFSVNGTDTSDLSLDDVVQLMSLKCKTLTLDVIKDKEVPQHLEIFDQKHFVKALFSYYPFDDVHLSCQAAGLEFTRGDILEIIDKSDHKWWQARRVGDKSMKIGLIPSKTFQEQRIIYMDLMNTHSSLSADGFCVSSGTGERPMSSMTFNSTTINSSMSLESSFSSTMLSSPDATLMSPNKTKNKNRKGKKKCTVKFEVSRSEDYKLDDVATYQEVIQIMPDPQRPRPIFFVGVAGMQCDFMARKICEFDSQTYILPATVTSRARMEHEKDCKELQFVTSSQFDRERRHGNLINVKEGKDSSLGVSFNSVTQIQESGKTCVTEIQPKDLRNTKVLQLIPFVVLIKSPSMEKPVPVQDGSINNRTLDSSCLEESSVDIICKGQVIERTCCRYADLTMINEDIDTTLNQIYHLISSQKYEPQWVATFITKA